MYKNDSYSMPINNDNDPYAVYDQNQKEPESKNRADPMTVYTVFHKQLTHEENETQLINPVEENIPTV